MLVEITGRDDIPLYSGCVRPMVRELVTAENVHGKSGINGLEIFQSKLQMQPLHGTDFIINNLREAQDDEVTIVATGPLTNIGWRWLRRLILRLR